MPPVDISGLKSGLTGLISGRVCVLGVGNRGRGDDGAGPLLVDQLRGCVDADLIDGGSAPENHLETVVRSKPGTVLVVDAADFAGQPGDVRLVAPAEIGAGGLSTHALSLQMLCDYLADRCPCRIVMIAIQPATTKLGADMTPEVRQTVRAMANVLSAVLRCRDRRSSLRDDDNSEHSESAAPPNSTVHST